MADATGSSTRPLPTGAVQLQLDPERHILLKIRSTGGKRLLVYTQRDQVEAYLWLDPSTRYFELGPDEISDILHEAGLKTIDPSLLAQTQEFYRRLAADRAKFHRGAWLPQVIARGEPPRHGRSGFIRWEVEVPCENQIRLTEDDHGRIDFKELGKVVNVSQGQAIARIVEPTPGSSGRNIHGREIRSSPGRPARLIPGDNVDLDRATGIFRAGIDGHVFRRADRLMVEPVYAVLTDVDLRVGNIDFVGSVHCSADVLDGFTIRAARGIHVRGQVHDSTLIAGGDIYVAKGVTQRDFGRVQCGGRLRSRHLINARIDAGSDIHVETQVVNCRIDCAGRLHLPRGRLVGGSVSALGGIEVGELGSSSATRTVLLVSADDFHTDETSRIDAQMNALEEKKRKVETRLRPFIENKALVDVLPPVRRPIIAKLLNELERMKLRLQELTCDRDRQLESFRLSVRQEIVVRGRLHEGVDVCIDNCRRVFTETIDGPLRLRPDYSRADIVIESI